jgi:hypothetical protein
MITIRDKNGELISRSASFEKAKKHIKLFTPNSILFAENTVFINDVNEPYNYKYQVFIGCEDGSIIKSEFHSKDKVIEWLTKQKWQRWNVEVTGLKEFISLYNKRVVQEDINRKENNCV